MNPTALANAMAATTGVFFVVCRLLVSLFPDLMFSVAQSWLHGIELTKLVSLDSSIQTFIVGLISSAITVWIFGYIFGATYNYFNKR